MTRLALLVVVVVAGSGCTTKPSEQDCRKAITNMQVLMGTENLRDTEMVESQVRRCKGGSKKKAVDCAIKAQSLDDLRKCEFYKVPEGAKGVGVDSAGSGAAPAGSGSAAGSGAGSDAGSGSAAIGGGSASGSAAPGGSAATPGAAAGSAATSAGSAVGSAK